MLHIKQQHFITLFDQQALCTPHAIALEQVDLVGEDSGSVTYQELVERSTSLAHQLLERGLSEGDVVALQLQLIAQQRQLLECIVVSHGSCSSRPTTCLAADATRHPAPCCRRARLLVAVLAPWIGTSTHLQDREDQSRFLPVPGTGTPSLLTLGNGYCTGRNYGTRTVVES